MLALDAATGKVARGFVQAGVRCILLKGPAIARWLYDEDELLRSYYDIDLLVSPGDVDTAAKILQNEHFQLSLSDVALPHGRRPHAQPWIRPNDAVSVDLHDTLPGVGAPPEVVWHVLTKNTGTLVVGGEHLEILGEPARVLLVALHGAHHGVKDAQALEDIARAVARVPESTWREAATLAETLDAMAPFVAGLTLSPDGRRLATTLGLPDVSTVETVLRARSAPELAHSFDWLVRTPGWRPRARLVGRKFVPPREVLKARSKLARRGRVGLAAAYAVQPLRVTWQAAPALGAWLAARRRARRV
jgi:hypothetical protein